MFIKLTMQNHDDFSIYLNLDKVVSFFGYRSGENVWTEVIMQNGMAYSVTESCEEIQRALAEAGGRG